MFNLGVDVQGVNTPHAAAANLMVARMCLLIRLLAAKWCCFGLEQPSTSCMEKAPRMQALAKLPSHLSNGKFHRVQTFMGAFGKPCPKSTFLYGNGKWMADLAVPLPPDFKNTSQTADTSIRADGSKAVTGRAKELKESQGYTDAFCTAVFQAFQKNQRMTSFDFDPPDAQLTTDKWADANPDSICDLAGIPNIAPW